MKKWVITADIIKSRELEGRKELQTRLERVLENINSGFAEQLASEFTITLGDQFRGVVHKPETVLTLVLHLINHLKDVSLRFGIAYGEIINPERVTALSGAGYELALASLEQAKKKKLPTWCSLEKFNDKLAGKIINLVLFCFIFYFNKFSSRQKEIMFWLLEGKKQKQIAEQLNISQPAVSQAVEKINWSLFKEIYTSFPDMVSHFQDFNTRDRKLLADDYLAFIGQCDCDAKSELDSLLSEINKQYRAEIKSRFVVSVPVAGGRAYEFQGLMAESNRLYAVLTHLFAGKKTLLVGLGTGDITTELKPEALGMDGPAFYRARQGLERATSRNCSVQLVFSEDKKRKSELFLSLVITLALQQVKSWTARQWEAAGLISKGLSCEESATQLGISGPAVSDRLVRAGWREYSYVQDIVEELLAVI